MIADDRPSAIMAMMGPKGALLSICAVTLDCTRMMTLQVQNTGKPKVFRCRYYDNPAVSKIHFWSVS